MRAGAGDVLPDDLARALENEAVACGWVRASGVLAEVELRAYDADTAQLASSRRIAGPVHALSIEGSVGLDRGELTVGLRAVLARETDRGMEVLAGEIASARVVALECFVTAFDDLALGRALDADASIALLADPSAARYRSEDERPAVPAAAKPATPAAPAAWSEAIAASAASDARAGSNAPRGGLGGAIPQRPGRPAMAYDDTPYPEPGDFVEHFAFGRAEVLKSDGDRLHLKIDKDGRIKEIALGMLKVTPLESNGPHRRFKLDRKI
jgi:predicted DNA-binding protein with PD1-like motif